MPETEKVAVTLSHPWKEHKVGARLALDPGEARRLVNSGHARYATKTAAVAAEGEAGAEKTVAAAKKTAGGKK